MLSRIQREISGASPTAVKKLILDNCKASKIEGLDEFTNLKVLTVVNSGLTTLAGFSPLGNLKRLELSDNRLHDGLEHIKSPKLECLKLSNNKFSTYESLTPLQSLESLKSLDLFNCPISSKEDYREKIFGMISSLKSLDGLDKNGDEYESSDDEEIEDLDVDVDEYEEDSSISGEEENEEPQPGLEYLKREDLEEDEEDDTFETNGTVSSDEDEGLSEDISEEDAESGANSFKKDTSTKRSHDSAFPEEEKEEPCEKKH